MKRARAIAGSLVFLLAAPGMVAGVVPWLVAGQPAAIPGSIGLVQATIALLLIGAAVAFLLHAFAHFALAGRGTPAPVAPTERLVVSGIYRYVRNPMYLAVMSIIAGQALLWGSLLVAIYGVIAGATMISFVKVYEEPVLAEQFGADYVAYRNAVPGWWPRLTPWRGD